MHGPHRLSIWPTQSTADTFLIFSLVYSYDVPLVADIHFQPAIALMVAECFEKIRINPGNFADGRKTFDVINYDDPKQVWELSGVWMIGVKAERGVDNAVEECNELRGKGIMKLT